MRPRMTKANFGLVAVQPELQITVADRIQGAFEKFQKRLL
jgi:hypothetical protein